MPISRWTAKREAQSEPISGLRLASGLYYYRALYYDPSSRRFIAEDPVRFAGGDVNLYAYVGNNPTNFRDPLGLFLFGLAGGVSGSAGLGSGAAGTANVLAGVSVSPGCIGVGAAAGGGAFVGAPGSGVGLPGRTANPGGAVLGVAGSKGFGAFFSNANTFSDLSGPFTTTQVTLLVVNLEVATSGNTFIFSASTGVGLGLARFTTLTPPGLTGNKNLVTHPALPTGSCLGGRKDPLQR